MPEASLDIGNQRVDRSPLGGRIEPEKAFGGGEVGDFRKEDVYEPV